MKQILFTHDWKADILVNGSSPTPASQVQGWGVELQTDRDALRHHIVSDFFPFVFTYSKSPFTESESENEFFFDVCFVSLIFFAFVLALPLCE